MASIILKLPIKQFGCKCKQNAGASSCGKKKCSSVNGHHCICNIDSCYYLYSLKKGFYLENFDYCQAEKHACICKATGYPSFCKSEEHVCICNFHGQLKCRSKAGEHKCTCGENEIASEKYSGLTYVWTLGSLSTGCCKATGHYCVCWYNNTQCQAIRHICVCRKNNTKCQACH